MGGRCEDRDHRARRVLPLRRRGRRLAVHARLHTPLRNQLIQAQWHGGRHRVAHAVDIHIELLFGNAKPLAGRLEDQRGRKLLLAALADDSARVRAEAALALGEGGFMDALRPLMDLKASDPSPEVRQAAAVALKKLAPR